MVNSYSNPYETYSIVIRAVSKDGTPALGRDDGLVSHILHSRRDADVSNLTITWIDVEAGAEQVRHEHDPEQVYVIIAGEGVMSVGDDIRAVDAGDLVHIPANTQHGLECTDDCPSSTYPPRCPRFRDPKSARSTTSEPGACR